VKVLRGHNEHLFSQMMTDGWLQGMGNGETGGAEAPGVLRVMGPEFPLIDSRNDESIPIS
jgi:hypothetical protein